MATTTSYDLIAIGAGSAGIGATGVAARFGLRTLMIDRKPLYFGGDCLNFGCVPSKALIHVAHQFSAGRSAGRFGLSTTGKADFGAVMQFVHERQDIIRTRENPDHFREQGIDVEIGEARFVDEQTIEVNGKQFTAPKIILATGSRARRLEVEGTEKVARILNNESLFWELDRLPDRLLIVGGGPIGCEMGQVFQRLGSEVTIINSGDRILGKELPAFSAILHDRLRAEGVQIYNHAKVTAFKDGQTAVVESTNGTTFTVPFDEVLVAIGRVVRTENLGLDIANIEVHDGNIVVDEQYRTTNRHVWAIGDAAGKEKFSHGAEMHNRDLAWNFIVPFFKKKHRLDHFSWVTFTDPQVATFGLQPNDLKQRSIAYDRLEQSFAEDDRAVTAEYRYGKLILYISKPHWLTRKVRILGGSMIAPEAGELIQELQLAQVTGTSINTIFNRVYPYPVRARINQKIISTKRQEALTPWVKKLLAFLYKN